MGGMQRKPITRKVFNRLVENDVLSHGRSKFRVTSTRRRSTDDLIYVQHGEMRPAVPYGWKAVRHGNTWKYRTSQGTFQSTLPTEILPPGWRKAVDTRPNVPGEIESHGK